MYKVNLLGAINGDLLHTISIAAIPRRRENITIESSSLEKGFVTYEVDAVHYVHNPENEKFNVVIYVIGLTS